MTDEDATLFGTAHERTEEEETIYGGESITPTEDEAANALASPIQAPSVVAPTPRAPSESMSTGSGNSKTQDGLDRTRHANEAMELGVAFNLSFRTKTYGEAPKCRLELAAPPGLSTSGGKQARQPITLRFQGDMLQSSKDRTLVCGWLDSFNRGIILRNRETLDGLYHSRFNKPFSMSPQAYGHLLSDLEEFASLQALTVHRLGADPELAPKSKVRRVNLSTIILVVLLVLMVGVVLGYWLATR